jgi:hypothetical protein
VKRFTTRPENPEARSIRRAAIRIEINGSIRVSRLERARPMFAALALDESRTRSNTSMTSMEFHVDGKIVSPRTSWNPVRMRPTR